MPLTKEQKIYMGVLALAAGAWSVDRFILGGANTAPHHAAASIVLPDRATARSVIPLTPATKPSLCSRFADFSEKIPTLEKSDAQDAFVPPPHWLDGSARPRQIVVPGKTPEGPVVDVEQFRHDHKLTAVFRTGGGGAAVINGVLVEVGQRFGDGGRVQLVSLTAKTATLSISGTQVVLKIDGAR
jgi:hypothetical protein